MILSFYSKMYVLTFEFYDAMQIDTAERNTVSTLFKIHITSHEDNSNKHIQQHVKQALVEH